MAAVRRRTGSGAVVALVIFIVVAFIAIGLSLWLYQQLSITRNAVAENQVQFQDRVHAVYRENSWAMPETEADENRFRYHEGAYDKVAIKLREAADYEDLKIVLGWEHPSSVQAALDASVVQRELDNTYSTMEGLLKHYENTYVTLTERVEELEGTVESQAKTINEKSEELARIQNEWGEKYNAAVKEHGGAQGDLRQRYLDLEKKYNGIDAALEKFKGDYDTDKAAWKEEFERLELESTNWQRQYEELLVEAQTPKKGDKGFKAEGKVLEVEPLRELVVLAGGEDEGRKKNAKFVVYTKSLSGDRSVKGEVLVSDVYETTALATILTQDERIIAGDLFVAKAAWDELQAGPKEETAGVAPEQPAEAQEAGGEEAGAEEGGAAEEEEGGFGEEEEEEGTTFDGF